MDNASLERIEYEAPVSQPKRGSLHDQLPKSYRPAEQQHTFKRSCAKCKFFEANPKGSLGKCHSARKADQLGAEHTCSKQHLEQGITRLAPGCVTLTPRVIRLTTCSQVKSGWRVLRLMGCRFWCGWLWGQWQMVGFLVCP